MEVNYFYSKDKTKNGSRRELNPRSSDTESEALPTEPMFSSRVADMKIVPYLMYLQTADSNQ